MMRIIIQIIVSITMFALPLSAEINQTVITSKKLDIEDKLSIATFIDDVEIDTEDMNVKADKMIAHYKSGESKKALDYIECFGNVKMINRKGEKASAKKGRYKVTDDTFELMDQVVLSQGSNSAVGDYLIYDRKTEVTKLQGSKNSIDSKVKVVFSKEKKDDSRNN